ncbi:RibD family protein [Ornithinibacillus halotolerans]|uniref:5-amino-6-(5-phosphoribosylamino)uracil reductase n=1 Tax=Ornithinibacillus halotolerans TaxID=1274357 RepID=A0A916RMJ1_9BACI|nr:RibD family protein [Ornithinibacillus halotolerans]GGA60747.1 5-amino-6-(5-phosphoribosylamino)uracil reductase [Ornithinibacillus halotolerans]
MKRPKVILNVFSSIDGKITTAPNHNVSEWTKYGIDGEAHDLTYRLYDQLDCDGLVSGSETLMVYGGHWIELEQPIYEPKKSKAYIVFDGRGRINWQQTEGLIVVTREDVPKEYIDQLEKKGITYITSGTGEHIDLTLALQKLYEMGFRTLGISGGGGINGAFLRNGLIDEISIVFAPVVVGGKLTPALFDCDELHSVHDITKLELKQVKQFDSGSIWMHYKVQSED